MTSFRIHLVGVDGSTRDLTSMKSLDFALEHTALSDWEATVKYDPTLENYAFGETYLYADHPDGTSDLLFRGYLESINSDERGDRTRIGGRGIAKDMTDAGVQVTYSNIKTIDAIKDFWATYTSFDSTVYTPDYDVVEGVQVANANDGTEFGNIYTQGANQPAIVANGGVEAAKTCFYEQAEEASKSGTLQQDGSVNHASDRDNTYGESIVLAANGDYVEHSFTCDYDIPAADHTAMFRIGNPNGLDNGHELSIYIDGTNVDTAVAGFGISGNWSWLDLGSAGSDLTAGSHTVRIEVTALDNQDVWVDIVGLRDTRFNYNLDNNVNSNYALEGPETHPDGVIAQFAQESSTYNVVGATIKNTNFNDLSGSQAIAFSYDGGTNWIEATNTDYLDDDQRGAATTTIDSRVTLGRFGDQSGSGVTPLYGFKPQRVDDWNLYIDGSTESTIEDQTFEGNPLEIAQDLHEYGGLRFHVKYLENSKEVVTYARGQSELQQDVDWTVNNRTRSIDVRDYANHVTVRGELSSGTRPTTTVQSDDEIQQYGQIHYDEINPSLSTSQDVRSRARTLLANKQREDKLKATLDIVPKPITPGPDYLVRWPDGSSDYLTLESVTFNESRGQAEGSLEFSPKIDWVGEMLSDRRTLRNTQDAT